MATTFDITGRINAVVSSGSLRMLKRLQKELRLTATALLKVGETTTANALGHTAMALDRVAGGLTNTTKAAKETAASVGTATAKFSKMKGETKEQTAITKRLSKEWKLSGGEVLGLTKAVGLLGSKFGYSANAQKEWIPALQKSLVEINKQKVAMVASGRAVTAHVKGQELFARTNQTLASGLHKVSGKLTDYDGAMAKSLGRSSAFKKEVNKIAGAVGKQGESFKSQFAALTKADDLWRKHVTNLHRAGEITTKQAQKMYSSYDHLKMPLSELQAQLKGTTQKATLFSRAMSSLVAHLKSFAAYAAAASIITGVAAVFGLATRAIIKYDQALHDLKAITRATNDEVVLMGEKIREIGRTTKFSASEVAVAMRTLGQAGFTAQEAIAAIGAVADLATGTLTSMKTVVDLVTTAIRAFDLEATETSRVADIFANAVNRSKLTIDKLRIAFNYIGPIAAKTGITLEETATTTMLLANAGIRASTIGTGLRRTFQQLIEPSKELKAAIEAAGYTVEDFNPQMNEMRDIIRRLTEIVPDAESAFRMFSLRSSAAVAALSSQGVASFDALHSAVLRSGTAAEMAETQIEGLGIIFKQARDKAHDLALAIGEAGMTGVLRVLGKGLQMLFDGLRIFISSGLGKALIAVTALTASLYGLLKVWTLIKMSAWASAVVSFTSSVWSLAAAGEALAGVLYALQIRLVLLLGVVGAVYGLYRLYTSFLSTKVNKVNTEYIDVLDETHKKELERLESLKRLVSVVRDELATNRERSNALIELSGEVAGFNLMIDKEIGLVEDLTNTIFKHKEVLDKTAASFVAYKEKARLEDLVAQTKLFDDVGIAIKELVPKIELLKKHSEGLFGRMSGGIERVIDKLPIIGSTYESAAEKLKILQEGVKALESQQGEAYEKMITAVTYFGEITQEVWRNYMLQAGDAEQDVAALFVESEEKITRAHIEAYLKIKLARKSMGEEERRAAEDYNRLIVDLFVRINSLAARRLEKGLRGIREHYLEQGKLAAEFYNSDMLYMREKAGFEADNYKKILGLVSRYSNKRLAILYQSYEKEKALILSYDELGMAEKQERLTELKKKHANRRLKVERDVAESIIELAEEQFEVLAETYERASTAYDESIDRRISSIDKCFDYEAAKVKLQGERSRLALLDEAQYAERWVAIEASASLQRIGVANEYVRKKKDAAVALYWFEKRLADKLVDLESQHFAVLVALGEQAKNDRLVTEAAYHKQQLELIESARRSIEFQYEVGDENRIEKEKELSDAVVEISRDSTEKRLDILNGWSNYLSDKYDDAVENTRKYANKIIKLENEIAGVRRKTAKEIVSTQESTWDKIVSISRAKMTEEQLLKSKVSEAYNKMVEANRLVHQVGTKEALKQAKVLYGEAQTIYTGIGVQAAAAAKEGKEIGYTHIQAAWAVARAGKGIINVLKAEEEQAIKSTQAELRVAEQARASWADLALKIGDKVRGIQEDISALAGSMGELISSIDSLEDKDVTVKTDEQALRLGINLVDSLRISIAKLQDKTVIITTRHVTAAQGGGPIRGLARGGKLPGFGGGDRVKALLEAGEFVINKSSVRKYGVAMFDAYNSMAAPVVSAITKPLRFAFGGLVGKKPQAAVDGPASLLQINKTIDGLSEAIDLLNKASSALNLGDSSLSSKRMRERGEESLENPLDPSEYELYIPNALRGIVKELTEALADVAGEDKSAIDELVELLVPGGLDEKKIRERLSGRKLIKAEDVEGVVLSLEEQKADLVRKQEEIVKYQNDLKKTKKFMEVAQSVVEEASRFTATAEPYTVRTNQPNADTKQIVAEAKFQLAEADPMLDTSMFNLSDIRTQVEAYLDFQSDLADKQSKNMRVTEDPYNPTGILGGSRSGRWRWIERMVSTRCGQYSRTQQGVLGAKHTRTGYLRCAAPLELALLDEAEKLKFGIGRTIRATASSGVSKKREILRSEVDKYQVQSSLNSLVKEIRGAFTFEPISFPDTSSVKLAASALSSAETIDTDPISLSELRDEFQRLVKEYFENLPKFALGGQVSNVTDSLLARLTPGEFVLKADTVRQIGLPFLNALNTFKRPIPAFAAGGLVESLPVPSSQGMQPAVSGSSPVVVINGDFYVQAAADDPSAVRAIDEKLAELVRSGRSRFMPEVLR